MKCCINRSPCKKLSLHFLDKSYLVLVNNSFNFAARFGYFALSFEIRKRKSSNLVLPFQDCFSYLGSLKIPYEF